MSEPDASGVIKSVQKGLRVLKYLMNEPGDSSLGDIQSALGYNGSTAHHILKTLIQEGFVSQNINTKKYDLGPELFHFCLQNTLPQKFYQKAYPYLEECVAQTGETTNLFIRAEEEAVCVAGAESPQTLKAFLMIGRRIPLTCTAAGKVFLAFMEGAKSEELVRRVGLKQYLPNTITDSGGLAAELARVKQLGYAVEREEYEEMITAIAAPVFQKQGGLIAVVSNISPSMRTDEPKVIHSLCQAAQKISRALEEVYY